MIWREDIKATLVLAIAALCILEFYLQRQILAFRDFEAYLLSLQWMLLVCLAVWCGCLLSLTFRLSDLALIGLLLVAMAAAFTSYKAGRQAAGAITLLAGVTAGKLANFLLLREDKNRADHVTHRSSRATFLLGLISLLAFSSWWHLGMLDYPYHGPRWMGLWDNPNEYAMLMGAGTLIAIGLLLSNQMAQSGEQKQAEKWQEIPRKTKTTWKSAILLVAAGMMAVGLLLSYSRGAWIGMVIGLLYLAKIYGKLKLRHLSSFLFSISFVSLLVICIFWNTPRAAPWYFQRLDLSRGSVQHRLAAWKAGFEIMRDHSFGVGWNNTVEIYQKDYLLLGEGTGAVVTNDYLMLGTQLGFPALVCFVAYCVLLLKSSNSKAQSGNSEMRNSECGIQTACRAAAFAMLVEFWFDGGLFNLATASVFWILLELGSFYGLARLPGIQMITAFSMS